jgi:hypothetical protein
MSRPAPFGGGGAWSPRDGGIIVFDASHYGPLLRVAAAGGAAVPVTKVDTAHEERSHGYPSFLSDGRRFVSLARTNTPRKWILKRGDIGPSQRAASVTALRGDAILLGSTFNSLAL